MKTRSQREQELLSSGLVDSIKGLFQNSMQDGQQFKGNIESQGEIINKIERDLVANFIANNDTDYVLQNYQKISMYLTTPQLKQNFMNAIRELATFQNNQSIEQSSSGIRR